MVAEKWTVIYETTASGMGCIIARVICKEIGVIHRIGIKNGNSVRVV